MKHSWTIILEKWHIKKAKDRVGEGRNVVSGVAQETQDVVDCAPDTIMTIKKGD